MTAATRIAITLLAVLATTAAQAGTISGRVTDERGQPLAGVDLDFFVVATGQEESANSDVTDVNGNFSTTVKNEVYDVYFDPVPGSRYASHVQRNVNLNTNQTVDVVLRDAWFVSGLVLRQDTGLPAVSVDLDFEDLTTGLDIATQKDNTGLDGRYRVAVPVGIYRVTFDGPVPGLPSDPPQLASLALKEISVTGDEDPTLPTVTLVPGFAVSGEILDEKGDGVAGADLDFIGASTGVEVYTPHDNTDARGRYNTIVPAGTYDLLISPPLGSVSATRRDTGIVVVADTGLGSRILADGWLVSGVAENPDGAPLRAVDLDFLPAAGGVAIPTTWDDTDAAGHFGVRVLPGTYDVHYEPTVTNQVLPAVSPGEPVFTDRNLGTVVLPFRDLDGDGEADPHDNCPVVPNPLQSDGDGDGAGDACDACPATFDPRQEDNDRDGVGDACDPDDDDDGVPDTSDPDRDGDGVANLADDCPGAFDPTQRDRDADGTGDACDPDDGEVELLVPDGDGALRWRPETGALSYHVYRQRLTWPSSVNFGICVADGADLRAYRDPSGPDPGGAFGYLISATMPGGSGSLGDRGDGGERPNLRPCP